MTRMVIVSLSEHIKELMNFQTFFQYTQVEITSILNNLKIEKDLVKALESQLKSCRDDVISKDTIIAEKNDALRVREETILELRSRVRVLSTAEQEKTRLNITETVEEDRSRVSQEEHTALEQRLQQVQATADRLEVNLQQTIHQLDQQRSANEQLHREKDELQELNRLHSDHLTSQRTDYATELRRKDEEIEQFRTLNRDTRESLMAELRQRDERIRELEDENNRRRSQSQTSSPRGELQDLRNELQNSRIQLEETQSELADTKSELEDIQRQQQAQLGSSASSLDSQSSSSRDWILGRGEIAVTDSVLGTGAWGNVKMGQFRGTRVAVKQIHLLILSPHNRRLFEREMSIASRCRHPCLVQFIGATNDDGTPLFVMELLKTDLRSVLSRAALPDSECRDIGYDVIRALVYLHKSKPVPIIHRDISSSNVLLYHGGETGGWRAKLSDYGAANFLRLSMTRHPGALLYSAPEASTIDQSTKVCLT